MERPPEPRPIIRLYEPSRIYNPEINLDIIFYNGIGRWAWARWLARLAIGTPTTVVLRTHGLRLVVDRWDAGIAPQGAWLLGRTYTVHAVRELPRPRTMEYPSNPHAIRRVVSRGRLSGRSCVDAAISWLVRCGFDKAEFKGVSTPKQLERWLQERVV